MEPQISMNNKCCGREGCFHHIVRRRRERYKAKTIKTQIIDHEIKFFLFLSTDYVFSFYAFPCQVKVNPNLVLFSTR